MKQWRKFCFNKRLILFLRKAIHFFLDVMKKIVNVDKIVVAAGVWSNVLARTIGDNFPLDTERGYHIIFENNSNLLAHIVWGGPKRVFI